MIKLKTYKQEQREKFFKPIMLGVNAIVFGVLIVSVGYINVVTKDIVTKGVTIFLSYTLGIFYYDTYISMTKHRGE